MEQPVDQVEYEVEIGESLYGKGDGLHLLKYEFMPVSVETVSPGQVVVDKNKMSVYLADKNGQEATEFQGSHKDLTQDETECVLLWDPKTHTFTLEKLDSSSLTLRPTRKKARIHAQELRHVECSSGSSSPLLSEDILLGLDGNPVPTEYESD